jgi:putative intracellular protease/amidase
MKTPAILMVILAVTLAASPSRGLGQDAKKKVYVCPPCGLDCDKLTFDKPGVCPHCGMTLIEESSRKTVTVAILLFNGVEIIDYTGPWEVFGQAGFTVHTVAESVDPIKTTFGQKVIPDYTFENSPSADVLLIPGGSVTNKLANAKLIRWIQSRSKDARYVMSVCTGAFLLAKAGLLDGQTATTFHRSIDSLARFAPNTKVVHDQRYVDNGKVITTAGLSSGIDGALHLVSKIMGNGAAQSTALALEYQWEPNSNYARAALADRYMPRFQGMEARIMATAGDRDRWETQVVVSVPESAAKIMEIIGRQIVSSTPHAASAVALLPPQTKPSRPEIEWKFTDEQGRMWRGVASAEPSSDEKGQYVITLKLARK